jgi:hypothetical protein
MTTNNILWIETGTSRWLGGSEFIHEWEGIDTRFNGHHWWVCESLDPDTNRIYELFLCPSDGESSIPCGMYSKITKAKRSAERLNALIFELRSSHF